MNYVNIDEHDLVRRYRIDFNRELLIHDKHNRVMFCATYGLDWRLGAGRFVALCLYCRHRYQKTGKRSVILVNGAYSLTFERILKTDAGFNHVDIGFFEGTPVQRKRVLERGLLDKAKIIITTSQRWTANGEQMLKQYPDIGAVVTVPTSTTEIYIEEIENDTGSISNQDAA